jgi:hypothetical protein
VDNLLRLSRKEKEKINSNRKFFFIISFNHIDCANSIFNSSLSPLIQMMLKLMMAINSSL